MPTADELINAEAVRGLAAIFDDTEAKDTPAWSSVRAAADELDPLSLSQRARSVAAAHRRGWSQLFAAVGDDALRAGEPRADGMDDLAAHRSGRRDGDRSRRRRRIRRRPEPTGSSDATTDQ